MSDTYGPSIFYADPAAAASAGALTYPQLEARRRIAMALATRNRPYPKTIGEGLTALGEGLGEGYINRNLEQAEIAQRDRDSAARPGMYGPPAAPAPAGPKVSEADGDPVNALALANSETPVTDQKPQMPIEEWKQRIARNETGGQKDPYSSVGPVSRRGDYPYGKYQIMGENIPKWTKQFVGREMTPEEFLADKNAQETVANGQGGKYLAKYGPEGAGAAWFAGEKGMNDPHRKDTLGTHVAEYRRRFNIPLVSRDQVVASAVNNPNAFAAAPDEAAVEQVPVQLAALDGGATASDAPPPGREAIAASVARQQGIEPPVQVAAGPAPIPPAPAPVPLPQAQPVPPPALQKPAADPRPADPGTEPKLETFTNDPRRKPMMDAAMRAYHNNALTPELRAEAAARLQYLQNEAKDEYTKQWTVWHEKDSAKRAFDLKERDRQIAEETHRQTMQGTVTGAATPQPVDPRILGTPQSPQRTRIPAAEPKPEGVSQAQWSEQQKTKLSQINDAVDKGEHALRSSLELINLAKTHPGREWGLGGPGSYLRESPWAGDAYAFGAINKQLTSKNFMAGYQDLRGAGAIGVKEGEKAEQAQGSVDPNMKKEHYDAALQRLEDTLRSNIEQAQRKANRPVTAWGNGPNDPPAPDIGQPGTRGGRAVVYIGGDPAKDTSYKDVR